MTLDESHDPALRSWVASANDRGTDFPVQNLPFGVFRHDFEERPRVGIAIGDQVLDCLAASRAGCFSDLSPLANDALQSWSLNALLALGRADARAIRLAASRMLREGTPEAKRAQAQRAEILAGMDRVSMLVPAEIGDYTDFYASIFHATNVGALFRPDAPLLPNYKYVPIGYHGRASSIVPNGTPVRRPRGQVRPDASAPPSYAPSASLDYELEIGALVCGENTLGETVPIARAEERVFGLCLLNDWSARDVQSWEYQPLGPFLAKSFATTAGPWVVTLDALEPFRTAAFVRPAGDPAPLPYLTAAADGARGGFAITLEVWMRTAAMRAASAPAVRLTSGAFASMYWTVAQLLTHHSSNGCNLRPGDLLGSGTVSGPEKSSRGCLLELTSRGAEPVSLPSGETRAFLADGDEVIFRGWCE
ncbi:MAG TPA: fumarylacetoacetase, partial [Gemmatimonadaceae bacterium]|nr:fumarylacetoacetase [Gemmatimonadaceae bacterium]